jgi:hypothetical protein
MEFGTAQSTGLQTCEQNFLGQVVQESAGKMKRQEVHRSGMNFAGAGCWMLGADPGAECF